MCNLKSIAGSDFTEKKEQDEDVRNYFFVSYFSNNTFGNITFWSKGIMFSQSELIKHLREEYKVRNPIVLNFIRMTGEEYQIFNKE